MPTRSPPSEAVCRKNGARARFVGLAVIGHATNIITGLAVIGHATNIITGLAILSMAGIVVAAAILTPIGVPTVPTSPILMAILPISTNVMDSFVNMA
jgi:hypothetical protein